MTRSIRRACLAFLSALLATGSLLAVTAAPASALLPLSTFSILSSDGTAVYGQNVELTATLSGGASTPEGTVDILDGVTTICPSVALVTGGATAFGSCIVANLSVGTHDITASYSGDESYDPAESTDFQPAFAQEVAEASTTTTLASDTPSSTFGDSVTLTATIAPVAPGAGSPTGDIEFTQDGVTIPECGDEPIVSGVATCTTSSLPGGTYDIDGDYPGDGNFLSSSATPIEQTVAAAGTTTALISAPNPSSFNGAVTLTATVSSTAGDPEGNVAFKTGGNNISACAAQPTNNGVATCVTTTLAVGVHSLTAVYAGDDAFATSTSPAITQTIAAATTVTELTSDVDPSKFGQAVTLDATVTSSAGVPTGSVDFYVVRRDATREIIATEPLIDGVATTTRRELAVRMNTPIVAEYTGAASYGESTDTIMQTVSRSLTRTLMRSSANPSRFGQVITLTVDVRAMGDGEGIPKGKVAFYRVTDGVRKWIGTAALVNGSAELRTSKTPVGQSGMIAQYNGNGNFRPSSRTGVQRVLAG